MKELCKLKEVFKAIYIFESKLKKEFDLSINEAITLCALETGLRNSGEMADEIGISVSRMSRVFGSLEEKGFVDRKLGTDDKRKMIFTISVSGRKRLKEIKETKIQFPDIIVAGKTSSCD